MKIKFYIYPTVIMSLFGLSLIISSYDHSNKKTDNANGQAAGTTAPGESHTCSQSGCHGSGNGNGTTGGLADNAGPGNITITSTPSMPGNTYVPGTVYQMSITVNETGKTNFGFVAQMLDNSGNTDLHVNNTSGTITVTDAVRTHTMAAFGTGRMDITQLTDGGLSNDFATFSYQWKAPSTGTVNVYTSATACNHNAMADAGDNVYTKHVVLTPNTTTGVESLSLKDQILLFPNPASDFISFSLPSEKLNYTNVTIINLNGQLISSIQGKVFEKTVKYDVSNIPSGVYFMKIISEKEVVCKKFTKL